MSNLLCSLGRLDLYFFKLFEIWEEKFTKNARFFWISAEKLNFWKISDKSNQDQLKAVTGICFMIGSLIIMGLYSGLV